MQWIRDNAPALMSLGLQGFAFCLDSALSSLAFSILDIHLTEGGSTPRLPNSRSSSDVPFVQAGALGLSRFTLNILAA